MGYCRRAVGCSLFSPGGSALKTKSSQPCAGSRFVKDAPDASGGLGVETYLVLVSGFQRVFGRRGAFAWSVLDVQGRSIGMVVSG